MRAVIRSIAVHGALAAAALCLAGCDSGKKESERERESSNAPAAQVVRSFYDAANHAAGEKACALLTDGGVRSIVHQSSRPACIRTINALEPGSFDDRDGELLAIEGVEEDGADAFAVDAALKGRSGGTYRVVRRNGMLLIDGFQSDEG